MGKKKKPPENLFAGQCPRVTALLVEKTVPFSTELSLHVCQ